MSTNYEELQKEIMDSLLPMVNTMSEESIKTMINDMSTLPQEFRDSLTRTLVEYKRAQK